MWFILIGIAAGAVLTVLLWLLWWPLGLVCAYLVTLLSEELLIAHRAEQAPITDWEARRKELGY